jgi:hypothetical protein
MLRANKVMLGVCWVVMMGCAIEGQPPAGQRVFAVDAARDMVIAKSLNEISQSLAGAAGAGRRGFKSQAEFSDARATVQTAQRDLELLHTFMLEHEAQ